MKNAALPSRPWSQRALDWIEWAGNKLPDPAVLFLITLLLQAGYVQPRWIQPL